MNKFLVVLFFIFVKASVPNAAVNVPGGQASAGVYDNGVCATQIKIIDWQNGNKQKITLAGSCTLQFIAPAKAGTAFLEIFQDQTGGRVIIWPDLHVKWPHKAAPKLTASPRATDIVSFFYDGNDFLGQASLDF